METRATLFTYHNLLAGTTCCGYDARKQRRLALASSMLVARRHCYKVRHCNGAALVQILKMFIAYVTVDKGQ